jgi:restriction system protein
MSTVSLPNFPQPFDIMYLLPLIVGALVLIWIWNAASWLVILVVLGIVVFSVLAVIGNSQACKAREALELEALRLAEEAKIQFAAKSDSVKSEALARINLHRKVLRRKADQSIYKDDYGAYVFDRWFSEIDYFIDNVLSKECADLKTYVDRDWLHATARAIALSPPNEDDEIPLTLPEGMPPVDFEHYCAGLLTRFGWQARVTPASGDQGVDIIAEYSGVRAVFQCKLYASSVGNAAVQEIVAGRQFQQARFAAVISNAPFTVSARQLAAAANVHLLHFTELQTLSVRLGAD